MKPLYGLKKKLGATTSSSLSAMILDKILNLKVAKSIGLYCSTRTTSAILEIKKKCQHSN